MTEAQQLENPILNIVPPVATTLEMRTVTGYPILEAFAMLNAKLPDDAYKAIPAWGGKTLTDIQPAYLDELLLHVFGPAGLGWGYTTEKISTVPFQTKNGTEWEANCEISVWWSWLGDLPGVGMGLHYSKPIRVTGGSRNRQREWAEKGACTNALGHAWSRMGFQLWLYKGQDAPTHEPEPTPQPPVPAAMVPIATPEDRKARFLAAISKDSLLPYATEAMRDLGLLKPGQQAADIALDSVPVKQRGVDSIIAEAKKLANAVDEIPDAAPPPQPPPSPPLPAHSASKGGNGGDLPLGTYEVRGYIRYVKKAPTPKGDSNRYGVLIRPTMTKDEKDGAWYSTFDDNLGVMCERSANDGKQYYARVRPGKKGFLDLMAIWE